MQGTDEQRLERALAGDDGAAIDGTSARWVDRFVHGGSADDADAARRRVDDILGSDDFEAEGGKSWAEKLSDWLESFGGKGDEEEESEYTAEVGSAGASTSLDGLRDSVQVFGIVVLALLVVALIVLLARRFERKRRGEPEELTLEERVASRVEELRRRAREAAAAGQWVEALRLEFFALVVGLGERGDLEYRDAWTNRELLERGSPRPAVQRALRPVVRRLDAHSFGHVPSGPEEVAEFQAFCERLSRGTS